MFSVEGSYRHLEELRGAYGTWQHAVGRVPNPAFGYSADDLARALIAWCEAGDRDPGGFRARSELEHLAGHQGPDGNFHNYRDADGRIHLDQQPSEDVLGRVTWALGHVIASGNELADRAASMLDRALPRLLPLSALRARSFAILGLALSPHARHRNMAQHLVASIQGQHARSASSDWTWPEDELTYENARVPQAVLRAGRLLGRPELVAMGRTQLDWLLAHTMGGEGHLGLVGNRGWWRRGSSPAPFDQQPVDAGSTVEACCEAYLAVGEGRYLDRAQVALEWYGIANRASQPMIDLPAGGVFDGLQESGINRNQGAESTLSLLLAGVAWKQCSGEWPRVFCGSAV